MSASSRSLEHGATLMLMGWEHNPVWLKVKSKSVTIYSVRGGFVSVGPVTAICFRTCGPTAALHFIYQNGKMARSCTLCLMACQTKRKNVCSCAIAANRHPQSRSRVCTCTQTRHTAFGYGQGWYACLTSPPTTQIQLYTLISIQYSPAGSNAGGLSFK